MTPAQPVQSTAEIELGKTARRKGSGEAVRACTRRSLPLPPDRPEHAQHLVAEAASAQGTASAGAG
jgi:hypothetical protein